MSHMTYQEQLQVHISFLRDRGLDVTTLELGEFVHGRAIGAASLRGECT
jgi:hypothetical protein